MLHAKCVTNLSDTRSKGFVRSFWVLTISIAAARAHGRVGVNMVYVALRLAVDRLAGDRDRPQSEWINAAHRLIHHIGITIPTLRTRRCPEHAIRRNEP